VANGQPNNRRYFIITRYLGFSNLRVTFTHFFKKGEISKTNFFGGYIFSLFFFFNFPSSGNICGRMVIDDDGHHSAQVKSK
jgi:hypothetical protein